MCVPSLSWQNEHYQYKMAQKTCFLTLEDETVGGVGQVEQHDSVAAADHVRPALRHGDAGIGGVPCTKRRALVNVSYVCRACLGKTIVFSIKWLQKKAAFFAPIRQTSSGAAPSSDATVSAAWAIWASRRPE
jgi:hypothetical protein